MSRWTDSLREPDGTDPSSWLYFAVAALNEALLDEALRPEGHPDNTMLTGVRSAAAEVRAWRKSLPEQYARIELDIEESISDRTLLLTATVCVLDADSGVLDGDRGSAYSLRWAEAYLRLIGLRLMDRGEGHDG